MPVERLRVDRVTFTGDSVFIKMPVFESSFKAKTTDSTWNGVWVRGTSGSEQTMPFIAEKNNCRFSLTDGPAKTDINGRWASNLHLIKKAKLLLLQNSHKKQQVRRNFHNTYR